MIAPVHAVLEDRRSRCVVRLTAKVGRVARPAIATLFAVLTVFACAEAAAAKAARSRHPVVTSHGQATLRKKPPAAHAPARVDNGWMERASAPGNGGGGGGGM